MTVSNAYTKQGPFNDSAAPALTAARLNAMETGIQVGQHLTGLAADGTNALAAANPGALFYTTDTRTLYRSNGSSWDQIAYQVPPAWANITFNANASAWDAASYPAPQYRIANGLVQMRGLGKITGGVAAATVIATGLPAPAVKCLVHAGFYQATGGFGIARLDIGADGGMTLNNANPALPAQGGANYINFDSLFYAL